MLVDCLRDDCLNAGAQSLRPWRALSRQEGCDIAVARRSLPQQRPYTPALDPEFLCDGVHIGLAAGGSAGQRREKIAPARGLGPLRVAETSLIHHPRCRTPDVFVSGKANPRRCRRHDFAGVVAEQHGIRPERPMNAPASAGMLDLDASDEALLHVTACQCWVAKTFRPECAMRRGRPRVIAAELQLACMRRSVPC